MPNILLMYINLLDSTYFVDSLQSALQNDCEMYPERGYFYIGKSLEEIFHIDLQVVFADFYGDFVLYGMHNELDMWLEILPLLQHQLLDLNLL